MVPSEVPFPPGVGKGEPILPTMPMMNPMLPGKLNVGLYPNVPMLSWFQGTIMRSWGRVQHTHDLNFVHYDAYNNSPPSDLDVFAFDAIRLEDMKEHLHDFELSQSKSQEFLNWTRGGLWKSRDQAYALPYLGCTSILIYRKNDDRLNGLNAGQLKWETLRERISASDNQEAIPPPGRGLLVDLRGGTTLTCFYLQSIMQRTGVAEQPARIPTGDHFDEEALAALRTIVRIAGDKQATYQDLSGYSRITMFQKGYGQAYIGYPEHFYFFPRHEVNNYDFYPLPLTMTKGLGLLPTYTDAIGVNKRIESDKMNDAINLVKLIAGLGVQNDVLSEQDPGDGNPQYLTPVRQESLNYLVDKFSRASYVYPGLNKWVGRDGKYEPIPFRLERDYREKILKVKPDLQKAVFGNPLPDFVNEFEFHPQYARTPGGMWHRHRI